MRWFTPTLAALACALQACATVEYTGTGGGGSGAGTPTGGETTTTGGAPTGGAAEGGGGSTTTNAGGGGSTTTGIGGAPPALTDTGLLVRYYLDEAPSGSPPGTSALDAAPAPLNLPITWGPMSEMYYAEVDGQRGLQCTTAGLDARASTGLSATKLHTALIGSHTGTLEAVVVVSDVHISNSRIIHIGTGQESGRFSMTAGTLDTLNFYWRPNDLVFDDVLAGHWPLPLAPAERVVLQIVLDTNEPVPLDRIRLYRNGDLVSENDGTLPALGESITFADDLFFVLGNREIGERTFAGTLHYAAVYQAALTGEEISNNASSLLASDDRPDGRN